MGYVWMSREVFWLGGGLWGRELEEPWRDPGRREAAPEKCGQKGSALVMPWVVSCTHVCLTAIRILPSIVFKARAGSQHEK